MSALEASKTAPQPAGESYSRLCLFQLTARRAGTMPAAIKPELNNENPPLELMNRLIQPIEKSAVLYQMASITSVFEALLKKENSQVEDDLKNKIAKIKDDLLKLAMKYQHTHAQLNLLKILSFRLTTHINQLLDKPAVKTLKIVTAKLSGSRSLDRLNSSTLAENLQSCALQAALYIHQLEKEVVCDEKDIQWPAVFDKAHFDTILDAAYSNLSDSQTKQLIKNLQGDLELLHGLSLAPRTLVPLAIISCRDYQKKSAVAIQELEGMLLERLKFLVKMMKEMQADNFPLLKGRGAEVKKCKAKLKEVSLKFIQDYEPALRSMLQRMQDMYREAYMTPASSCAKTHIQTCRKLLIELKKPDSSPERIIAKYYQVLKDIEEARQSPVSEGLSLLLINHYILPLNDTSIIFYRYSIPLLTQELEQFIQAYESYEKLIPVEQRGMKTDLFRPFDLLTFHLLESLRTVLTLIEDQEVIDHVLNTINGIHIINRQAFLWYQASFPYITHERITIEKLLENAIKNLQQILAKLQTQDPQPQATISQLERVLELFECLSHFLHSSSAYPFLFATLGKESLQKDSYEHQLMAQMANVLYKRIQEFKDYYFVHEISINWKDRETGAAVLLLSSLVENMLASEGGDASEMPSLVAFPNGDEEEYYTIRPPSVDLFAEKVGFYLHRHWEEIPSIQSSNLIENYPSLRRLFIPLERFQRDLSHWKLELEDNKKLEDMENRLKMIHSTFFEPYQILTRYFSICTLSDDVPSLSSSLAIQPKRRRQIFEKKPTLSLASSPIEKEEKNLIQALHAHVKQVGESLALPTDALQVDNLEAMRDCYRQVIYHLNSIEDLWNLEKEGSLSFYQHKALLVHQAAAIEQTVKLAALARPKDEQKRQTLTQQLKSSHSPSQFFTSFLPRQAAVKKAHWDQAFQAVCAVDGFLTVPARYAVGHHAWLELLTEWEENQEVQVEKIQEKECQTLQKLEQDNLSALSTLFEDIKHSLPTPQTSVVFVSQAGVVEGLLDQGLLHVPHQLTYSSFKFNQLKACLNSFFALKHVQPLSPYETTTSLVRRREQIHANLDIIAVNSEEIQALLEEANTTQWCSSYASTLLLRGAVCLEKSIQTLLFWLPVSSESDDDQHYLLARRAGPEGTNVPLWHTHSIQDSAVVAATGLEERGKANQAERMQQISQQFAWLDPFIKQLYRYPFSVKENSSAMIPRLFHALAELRRSISEGTLIESSKRQLQETLSADCTELLERFDGLIQGHLTAQVVVPVHEMLRASLEILKILQSLSSR